MGSDPLPNFNAFNGKIIKNTYRYDIDAIDYVDQQAKLHDEGYDRLNAVGASSLFSDLGTAPYDEAALSAWTNFYDNKNPGDIDPFNNQKVSFEEIGAAWRSKTLFSIVLNNKKLAIASFMSANYKDAKHGSKFLWGKRSFSKDEIDSNYQMFLNKYMKKDENGQWIRRDDMWEGNKDKGFTPKKQT